MFPSTTAFVLETPLPHSATPSSIIRILHDHRAMMKLSPLVVSYRLASPPSLPDDDIAAAAAPSTTYEITENVPLLPGGLWQTSTVFEAEFTDLPDGLLTIVHASLGVEATARWLVIGGGEGNSERGEVARLREEVELRCSGVLMPFVKGTMRRTHEALHQRMMEMQSERWQQEQGAKVSETIRSNLEQGK
ncbi:MAG: hypothetical protein M1839_009139 [Geoglossum umbratile]|nr:MAG: hypothetical protein M1839_009139 [Geoglossum umbratile]